MIILFRLVIFIRKEAHMKSNLLVSGTTNEMISWDVEKILSSPSTKDMDIDRLIQYEWDNKISRSGMTYLEIEQFNNTYNNWR